MKELVLYIHGKGGCPGESEHYKPLFPECEVIGLDYQTSTPWETGEEIWEAVTKLNAEYDCIDLIANRILYGSRDNLTSHETITAFAKAHGAELTVMDGGEHWFHTDEQMQFLDNWIIKGRSIR